MKIISVDNSLTSDKDRSSNETGLLLPKTSHTEKSQALKRSRHLLYVSHLFAKISEVTWQFCLIFFLAALTNYESLILVSTYGLLSTLSVFLLGGTVGKLIDEHPRRYTVQFLIASENMAVFIATTCCYILLGDDSISEDASGVGGWIPVTLKIGVSHYDSIAIGLLAGIHIFGAMAMVLDKGFTVAMEKDWIVVMSKCATEPTTWLSETNVAMTQIDLSCKVMGPAFAGFAIAAFGDGDVSSRMALSGAALFVGALNLSSLVVEYICTMEIYRLLPALAIQKEKIHGDGNNNIGECGRNKNTINEERNTVAEVKRDEALNGVDLKWQKNRFCPLSAESEVYMRQKPVWGGISLALLYLNVLSFGAIMTAYLIWRGMRVDTIGVWRGISSLIGLLGTLAYKMSSTRYSLESTGMWSITFQFLCLTVCYFSLFVPDYFTSISMLIGGVCTSRIGLWVFDISIKQLMQELVPPDVCGVVGGVQHSIQAFFELVTFSLGILFPDPSQFFVLVGTGYLGVGLAMVIYALGVYTRSDTLRV